MQITWFLSKMGSLKTFQTGESIQKKKIRGGSNRYQGLSELVLVSEEGTEN
jgi:hypothetical protein